MMLFSTMRTLIGGTAPSRTDPGACDVWLTAFLDCLFIGGFGRDLGDCWREGGGVIAFDSLLSLELR